MLEANFLSALEVKKAVESNWDGYPAGAVFVRIAGSAFEAADMLADGGFRFAIVEADSITPGDAALLDSLLALPVGFIVIGSGAAIANLNSLPANIPRFARPYRLDDLVAVVRAKFSSP